MQNYLILSLMLCQHVLLAQTLYPAETDSIIWNAAYKLKWSDFQGKPDSSLIDFKAGCAASIYVVGKSGDLPSFKVTNSFIKKDSWTLDTTSDNLLEHEQLHFDISEVYTRKIRFSIDSLRNENNEDINIYSTIIKKLLVERECTGKKYDTETYHGLSSSRQKEWRLKIDKLLLLYIAHQSKLTNE